MIYKMSNTSRLIDKLIDKKLVKRSLCKENRRKVEIIITGMGISLLSELDEKIETIFMMSDVENQIISSKFVKEIAKLNGKIDNFVTISTKKAIKNKYD